MSRFIPIARRAAITAVALAAFVPAAHAADATTADRMVLHAIPTTTHAAAPAGVSRAVAADAADRVVFHAIPTNVHAADPADDRGLSLPTVLVVGLLAAAASLGIAMLLRRGLRGKRTASA